MTNFQPYENKSIIIKNYLDPNSANWNVAGLNVGGFRELIGGVPEVTYTSATTATSSISASVNSVPISGETLPIEGVVAAIQWTSNRIWMLSTITHAFNVYSELEEGGNRISGIFEIKEFEVRLASDLYSVFPTDTSQASGSFFQFYPQEIQTLDNGELQMSYTIRQAMTYTYCPSGGACLNSEDKLFEFIGTGVLVFESTDAVYQSIIDGEPLLPIRHEFNVSKCTSDNPPFKLIPEIAVLKFGMKEFDGVMIGVRTTDQTWGASTTDCGPRPSKFVNVHAEFCPTESIRWGTPVFLSEIEKNDVLFNLKYNYDFRDVINTSNVGNTYYESATITISADNLSSLINGRLLIRGVVKRQVHSYTAMNDYVLPVDPYTDCASSNGTLYVNVPNVTSAGISAYVEYASSFVQEYQGDQRYNAPEAWVPSNGIGLKPENFSTDYSPSAWKRYMDGVGLGGDVPDYDTIYDKQIKKIKAVSNWSDINKYHIGQMCFGTPERAVIVGGHKVDTSVCSTGKWNGYHSMPTSKRVFIWDMTQIPEEDSYLKNYYGRKLSTSYDTETISISSNDTTSSLNVMIYEGESDIIIEKFGTATFDGSSKTTQVKFDKELPSDSGTDYSISMTPSDNVKLWWDSKTLQGFTINCSLDDWKGSVDWTVTSIIKVTQNDVNSLDTLSGYEFDK